MAFSHDQTKLITKKESDKKRTITTYLSYAYEHSPINFSRFTGWYYPRMTRIMGHPIFGIAPQGTDMTDMIGRVQAATNLDPKGRAYGFFGPTELSVYFTLPADIAQIYYKQKSLSRGNILAAFNHIVGSENIFSMPPGQAHKAKRGKLMQWVYNSQVLAQQAPAMQNIIDENVNKLIAQGTVASTEQFFAQLTMDIFARTQLASNPLGKNADQMLAAYDNLINVGLDPKHIGAKVLADTPVGRALEYFFKTTTKSNAALDQTRQSLHQAITENFLRPTLDEQGDCTLRKQENIFQEYFTDGKSTGEAFKEIIDDVGVLLLASHETTTRLLQFSLMLLAQHPDVLTTLRAELEQEREGKQEADTVPFIDKVIKETLRLFPSAPLSLREMEEPIIIGDIPYCKNFSEYEAAMEKRDKLNDVVVPAGAVVNISPWITQHREDLYPAPMKFMPERHKTGLDSFDIGVKDEDQFQLIPFGFDERSCLGRKLALQETKMVLKSIVLACEFSLKAEHANKLPDVRMCFTLKAKEKYIPMFFKARNKQPQSVASMTSTSSEAQVSVQRGKKRHFSST